MNEVNVLTLRDNAKNQLMQIKTVESGIEYLNKVKAIEVWVKAEKKDAELQNIIAEQKIRTQRILGELIAEGQARGEIRKQNEGTRVSTSMELTELGINKKESSTWQQIASIPNEVFEQEILEKKSAVNKAVGELTTTGMLRLVKGNVHVSNNSGENEWYTPKNIIERARNLFGTIHLDPASSDQANKVVKAEVFYPESDNGLNKKWYGNVWLNPPYSQPLISDFSRAVVNKRNEYEQILVLVNNATETNWLQNILSISNSVCFIKSRVKFIDKQGESTGAPLQGQVIVYVGENAKGFYKNFYDLGICMSRII